jgi:hypothetical protein
MVKQQKKKSSKPKFKSKFEETFSKFLTIQKVKFDYEKQKLKYVKTHTYVVDFSFDSDIIIETKGYFKAIDRTKMLDVKKNNPHLDIRFVFMNNNKLHKLSNTRYSDWCEKNNFKYHISPKGEIPKEWIKEINEKNTDNGRRRVSRKSSS